MVGVRGVYALLYRYGMCGIVASMPDESSSSQEPLAALRALRTPTVIGYVRVSTRMQVDGTSMEHQEAAIIRFCSTHRLALLRTCADPGRSGKSRENRPGLAECLSLAKDLRVGAVIVYRDDRLSRRIKDAMTLSSELGAAGIALIVLEPFRVELPQADGEESKLQPHIIQFFAESEHRLIRKRTVEGTARRAREGTKFGRLVAGYVRTSTGGIALGPGAEHIRAAFHQIAAGATARAVVRKLAEDYRLPDGGLVTRDQLDGLLRNRWVLGEYRYHLPAMLADGGGTEITHLDHHPALVDPLVFAQVQQVLDERERQWREARENAGRGRQKAVHGVGDPGITRCGACGGPMYCQRMPVGSPANRRWVAKYFCHTHHQRGNAGCPALPGPADEVDAVIRAAFISAVTAGRLAFLAVVPVPPLPEGIAPAIDTDLQERIAMQVERVERLAAASAEGDQATRVRLGSKLEKARADLATLEAESRRLAAVAPRLDDDLIRSLRDPAGTWDALDMAQRRALVTRCASGIVITDRVPLVTWRSAATAEPVA